MIRSERIAATFNRPFPGAVERKRNGTRDPAQRLAAKRRTISSVARYSALRDFAALGSRIAFHSTSLRCRRPGKGGGDAAPSWSDSALGRRLGAWERRRFGLRCARRLGSRLERVGGFSRGRTV